MEQKPLKKAHVKGLHLLWFLLSLIKNLNVHYIWYHMENVVVHHVIKKKKMNTYAIYREPNRENLSETWGSLCVYLRKTEDR